MASLAQLVLFCPCGRGLPAVSGLCRACYLRRWRSERYYGGHRERVLARDRGRCTICASEAGVCVHHRRPGVHNSRWLATVCRSCHARLHRRYRLPGFAAPALALFWEEQHPDLPRQIELPWAADEQQLGRVA